MGEPRPRTADRRAARQRSLGERGEALVAAHYAARGYAVLDRNWRCREGELDLVLEHPPGIVFCEVKTRRSSAFGTPAEAVTREKQRRLRLAAMRWLAGHEGASRGARRALRFDVASVLLAGDDARIEIVEGAF